MTVHKPYTLTHVLIVTGGRSYQDQAYVRNVLDSRPCDLLITGGYPGGVDFLATEWARARDIPYVTFAVTRTQWERFGRRAGPRRNQRMVDFAHGICARDENGEPDWTAGPVITGIAFPGNDGTSDCAWRMAESGIPLLDYRK